MSPTPTQLPRRAAIAIIGGGVMGASLAYHLAQRGARDIVLLERAPFFGAGATGKCAGGVRYQFSTSINIQLSQLSLPMLDRFTDEIGHPSGRRRCGYLFLLTRAADATAFKRHLALQQQLGVATAWLSGDEVRHWLPALAANDVLAATFNPDDGLADPHSIVNGYIAAARRLGVAALTDAGVHAIRRQPAGGYSLRTTQGDLSAELLVNAAGPWSGQVSNLLGVPLPIIPLRRQMLMTTATPTLPPDFPFVIDFAQSLYFHPEGDGLITGMSNPHESPGFDEAVNEEWEAVHLEAAVARLPLLATAGRRSHWAGLYEITPDAHPIIAAVPPAPGYYVVTGFSGHGFMHGPAAGLLMAEIILDGRAHTLDISALDYTRFAEGRLIREYNVI